MTLSLSPNLKSSSFICNRTTKVITSWVTVWVKEDGICELFSTGFDL